jgi:hypothetical protein
VIDVRTLPRIVRGGVSSEDNATHSLGTRIAECDSIRDHQPETGIILVGIIVVPVAQVNAMGANFQIEVVMDRRRRSNHFFVDLVSVGLENFFTNAVLLVDGSQEIGCVSTEALDELGGEFSVLGEDESGHCILVD